MTASSTFFSKCTTILVGVGLSWATLTNPDIDSLASGICGTCTDPASMATADEDLASLDISVEGQPANDSSSVTDNTPGGSPVSLVQSKAGTSTTQHGETHVSDASGYYATGPTRLETVPPVGNAGYDRQAYDARTQDPQDPRSVSEPTARADGSLVASDDSLPANERIRIQQISDELKHIGASHLMLDRLPQADTTQYRVRCDMAGENGRIKCCFEATRPSALAAMEEVLYAARQHVILNGGDHHAAAGQAGRSPWTSAFRN